MGARTRVLLVEDHDDLREAFEAILAERYDVTGLRDGSEALDILVLKHGKPPDVLVIDLMMPKISGLDLLRIRAANARLKKIPVIVLSGMPLRDMVPPGVDRFLQKPVSAALLEQTIEELLANRKKNARATGRAPTRERARKTRAKPTPKKRPAKPTKRAAKAKKRR